MATDKKYIQQGGRKISRWSFREGNVIEQNDAYIARIYVRYANDVNDLEKDVTEVFAVVRGNTEQQCDLRTRKLLELCVAGEFDNYFDE